ncbi:hypothetical protein HanRHA438_Chr16g0789191 [Helianthus annuus]|nr:hypothetical protein HanRHA438_Chr16g0789191 [Helianthus annuus]
MNVVSVKKNDLVKDSSVCFYDESGNQHVIVLNGVLQPDDFRRVWILFAQKFSLFDGRDSMNAFYEYDKGKYKLDRCLGSDVEFSFDSLILNALNSRLVKYRGFECGRKLGWGNIFLDNSLGMGCGSLMIGAHIWVMLCWFMNRGINGPDGLDDFGLWQWWKEWAAYFADKYKDWAGYLMKLCQIELNGNMLMKWVSNFGVGIIGLKFFLCEWAEWIMDGIYIIGNCAKIEAWVKERVRWWAKSDVGRMNYGSNLKKMMMCGWAWNVKDVHLLNRLVFRIWSYERGLCWPVGFRYGLGFFRKAHYSFGFWLG